MLILLVENIADDLNVIGISYTMGDWSIMAVDITSGEVWNTYFHEIWHAIEFKMMQENLICFDQETWDACNPADFIYTHDSTPAYIHDVENTLFHNESSDDIHFIDAYAKTSDYEDRARLMEYVMASDYYASQIVKVPALRKKLEIMSQTMRAYFDTTGWDTPYWERFL